MCNAMKLLVVVAAGIAVAFFQRAPAEAYELYYLSVGISHYRDATLDIRDADVSAREVARYLDQAGVVSGITLDSKPGDYVTREDVFGALNEIAGKARRTEDSLVVYYFIGHGRSSPPGYSHISVAGDYSRSDPVDVARARAVIETTEIEEILDGQGLHYILLMDNCYFQEADVGLQRFARVISDTFVDLGNAIDRLPSGLGELPKTEIVLYAAEPGTEVRTQPHPWNESNAIGPLARRLLLLLTAVSESGQGLSIERFLEQMKDPDLDSMRAVGDQTAWMSEPKAPLIHARPEGPARE